MTNKAPTRELTANRNIVPCIPAIAINDDKNWKRDVINFLINRRHELFFSPNLDGDERKNP